MTKAYLGFPFGCASDPNTLQGLGYRYENALAVVSQELGHFRPDITEVYLR